MENLNTVLGVNENKSPKKTSSEFSNFFSFNKMISLTFIQIFYVIGIITIIIVSTLLIIKSIDYENDKYLLEGIGLLFFGNIVWRLLCEVWILFFRLATSVSMIEKNCKK